MNIFLVRIRVKSFISLNASSVHNLVTMQTKLSRSASVCPTLAVKDRKISLICPPKQSLLLKETQTVHFNIPFVFQGRLSCLRARKPVT